jgi:hypothetical protein
VEVFICLFQEVWRCKVVCLASPSSNFPKIMSEIFSSWKYPTTSSKFYSIFERKSSPNSSNWVQNSSTAAHYLLDRTLYLGTFLMGCELTPPTVKNLSSLYFFLLKKFMFFFLFLLNLPRRVDFWAGGFWSTSGRRSGVCVPPSGHDRHSGRSWAWRSHWLTDNAILSLFWVQIRLNEGTTH